MSIKYMKLLCVTEKLLNFWNKRMQWKKKKKRQTVCNGITARCCIALPCHWRILLVRFVQCTSFPPKKCIDCFTEMFWVFWIHWIFFGWLLWRYQYQPKDIQVKNLLNSPFSDFKIPRWPLKLTSATFDFLIDWNLQNQLRFGLLRYLRVLFWLPSTALGHFFLSFSAKMNRQNKALSHRCDWNVLQNQYQSIHMTHRLLAIDPCH